MMISCKPPQLSFMTFILQKFNKNIVKQFKQNILKTFVPLQTWKKWNLSGNRLTIEGSARY